MLSKVISRCLVLGILTSCSNEGDSKKALSLYKVAQVARKSGNQEAAIQFYNKALDAKNHEFPEAYLGLAEVYIDMQMLDGAKVFIDRAEKIAPKLTLANYLRGKIYLLRGETKLAEAEFKKNPHDADSMNALGAIYDSEGKHHEAQLLYRNVISKDPNYIDAYNNMGLSLLLCDNYEKAISYLENACKLPDATPTYRSNLALAYGLAGDMLKAKSVLQQDFEGKELDAKIAYIQDMITKKP